MKFNDIKIGNEYAISSVSINNAYQRPRHVRPVLELVSTTLRNITRETYEEIVEAKSYGQRARRFDIAEGEVFAIEATGWGIGAPAKGYLCVVLDPKTGETLTHEESGAPVITFAPSREFKMTWDDYVVENNERIIRERKIAQQRREGEERAAKTRADVLARLDALGYSVSEYERSAHYASSGKLCGMYVTEWARLLDVVDAKIASAQR